MAKNDFDELMSIGIDIGKDTFHIVGFDPSGQRVLRKQIKRLALTATCDKLPRCIVGMEACLTRSSERMHRNKAAVALANKLARMAWSILTTQNGV